MTSMFFGYAVVQFHEKTRLFPWGFSETTFKKTSLDSSESLDLHPVLRLRVPHLQCRPPVLGVRNSPLAQWAKTWNCEDAIIPIIQTVFRDHSVQRQFEKSFGG